MPKFILLDHLVRSREDLTLGELATRIACVRSNVTQLIDRLERDGLVERVDDSADRRSVRAAITRAGRMKHADAARVLEKEERALGRRLSAADRNRLMELLEELGRSHG
jgi:DNA-binding MarR family transcriptional regulator